jgi:hypothetical protein
VWQVASQCDRRGLPSQRCIDIPFNLRFQESGIARRRRLGRHPDRTDRPGHIDERCTGGRSPASLSGPSQGTTRRPTAQSATARAHKGSSEERCETRGLVADRRLDPAALHSDGHLDQLDVAGTSQESVGNGLADGQHHVVSPGMAAGSCCKLVGRRGQPERSSAMRQAAFRLSPAAGGVAVMAWRRVLQARVEQLCHRTNVGAAWRQPSRALWQRPPAITVTAAVFPGAAALHRPLGLPQPVQLRRQRPANRLVGPVVG